MTYIIRDFEASDAASVDRVALAAFEEYKNEYSDWASLAERVSSMSGLSETGEIVVAENNGEILGAVAYVGPCKPKNEMFEADWPIIRSLVVDPSKRGNGIGRTLTDECIRRACRDSSSCIALHTSKIMKVALPLYERMGFVFLKKAPTIFGVDYGIYLKELNCQQGDAHNSDRFRLSPS